jgi:pseudouridine-5'-phosphate glycosidase
LVISLLVRDDVAAALQAGRPIVALESTVIAHGLPRPQNLETARAMEAAVREEGAIPATIAITEGRLVVGLSSDQLATFAATDGIAKVSRADLAAVRAARQTGATTVATTMLIAALAGIRVFATGGIGGVHRGAELSFDISADLPEIARTPVAVVCAGAKAILDLPRTLEMLETLGVPVVGYRTNKFPAFYVEDSGLPLQSRVDAPADANSLGAGSVVRNCVLQSAAFSQRAAEAGSGRVDSAGSAVCCCRGNSREGRDALSAGASGESKPRPNARNKYRPARQQRASGGAHCEGLQRARYRLKRMRHPEPRRRARSHQPVEKWHHASTERFPTLKSQIQLGRNVKRFRSI